MQLIKININDLKSAEYNPRKQLTPEDKEYQKIKNSIQEFGYVEPIIINKDKTIIGGHQRLSVLKDLGYNEVDCIVVDVDKTKEKALNIALNKITGEWDYSKLGDLLLELDSENYDLELTGFDDYEIENILAPVITNEIDEKKNNDIFYFDKEEIKQDIVNNWKVYNSLQEYIDNVIDIPTAKYQFNRLCQGYRDGYNISLLFNPHRLTTGTHRNEGIFYGIQSDKKYRENFARFMVDVENKVVPKCYYIKHIGLGSSNYQYVNEFQPYLARDIYLKYCKDGDKILNPCAGWDGRLIGLASCMFKNIEYVETDPSTKTFEGLLKLKDFLKLDDNFKQYNLPFEDLELKENYFDFAFTSPPYFDTEKYSDDEGQSYMRNSDYQSWRDNFLYVMIDKIMYSLKKNGKCILNVGNKRYPISDDIKKYLKEKYNVRTTLLDYSLDNSSDEAIRISEEDFILFQKKGD